MNELERLDLRHPRLREDCRFLARCGDQYYYVWDRDRWRYGVKVVLTPCRLGGERPWFICEGCGHRQLVLFERVRVAMETGQEVIMYGGYRIKPKSERVHASVKIAGWRPVAEVSVEREGSVLIKRIEPTGIPLAPSTEEADKTAVKAARSWIEKRAAFGENLNEAVLILKEWVKRN